MTGYILNALGTLIIVAALGRLVLSLLPPGNVGSHRLRELPTTWAISHLLGWLAVWLSGFAVQSLDSVQPGAVLVFWILVAAARLVTLPGSMVPGHAVAHERAGIGARAIFVFAALGAAAIFVLAPKLPTFPFFLTDSSSAPERLSILSWIALLILVDYALRESRRGPLGRSVAFAFGVFAFSGARCPDVDSAAFVAALAFLVPWLRRADRRACWLSLILFAGSSLESPVWLLVIGWTALFSLSTRAQRADAIRPAILIGLIGLVPHLLRERPATFDDHWTGLAVPLAILILGLFLLPRERTVIDATT